MNKQILMAMRIANIERELSELKKLVCDNGGETRSLRGIWKGVDISDEEIEEAKRSLASGIDKYESG